MFLEDLFAQGLPGNFALGDQEEKHAWEVSLGNKLRRFFWLAAYETQTRELLEKNVHDLPEFAFSFDQLGMTTMMSSSVRDAFTLIQ